MSEIIRKALEQRGDFEIITSEEHPNRVRYTGRVPADRVPRWLAVVTNLVLGSTQNKWGADVSKLYFLHELESGRKLRYSWRLIIQWDSPEAEDAVAEAITTAPSPAAPRFASVPMGGDYQTMVVGEVPLGRGLGSDRNVYPNGKGAAPVGTPPLIHRMHRG